MSVMTEVNVGNIVPSRHSRENSDSRNFNDFGDGSDDCSSEGCECNQSSELSYFSEYSVCGWLVIVDNNVTLVNNMTLLGRSRCLTILTIC